jgi:tetratricopeptide (TPR) repeat protein
MGHLGKSEKAKMKKIVVSILVFIGCLGTIALFSRENENNGTRLAEARKLVEQKSYGQALEIYSRLESWLNRDPDLSIEWARVYTYADRHPEAIAIFQRVIRNFPEQAKGIYK